MNRMILKFDSGSDWLKDMDTVLEVTKKAEEKYPDNQIDVEVKFRTAEIVIG